MATFDEELSTPKLIPGQSLVTEHTCRECGKVIQITYKHRGPSVSFVENDQNPFKHCPLDTKRTTIAGYSQEVYQAVD